MDRPLTTSDAATGGNPGTGANWMTVAQPGLFRGRQVHAALAMPGFRFATGYGLQPARAYGGTHLMPALAAPGLASDAGAFATPYTIHRPWEVSQPVSSVPRFAQHLHTDDGPTGSRGARTCRLATDGAASGAADAAATGAADAAATGTDAPLTGQHRTAPATIPPPMVKPSYQREWRGFVDWCKSRKLQYWPASSTTVAAFLEERATRVEERTMRVEERTTRPSHWTITHAQRAIASTHRIAKLNNPCESDLVKATVKQQDGSTQERRQRILVTRDKPIDSTKLAAIRQVALTPAHHSPTLRPDTFFKQRTLINAALCSVVLEAGLGYAEAASLEWRDLTTNVEGTSTITVRKRTIGDPREVRISEQANADLRAIADNKQQHERVFAMRPNQIGNRVRATAIAAGFDVYLTERRHVGNSPGGDHVGDSGTGQQSARDWQKFERWCVRRQFADLPATPHTVAVYFEHLAKSSSLRTIGRVGHTIEAKHREARYDNPCATRIFQDRYQHLCQKARQVNSTWLDRSALAAVRATAIQRRSLGGRWESEATTQHRSLVDIALCSVLHAARLNPTEASELRWRDVDESGEHGMRLTVRKTEKPSVFEEFIELNGQVVCDLQSIRGGAGPDDKIFGLSFTALYARIKGAKQAAGLDPMSRSAEAWTDL